MERSIPELTLSKLCTVQFVLQNRALFEGEKRAKGAEKRVGRGVASKGGKKEKSQKGKSAINLSNLGNFAKFDPGLFGKIACRGG